jgi:hypothetical protein
MGERTDNLVLRSIFAHTSKRIFTCRKYEDTGPPVLLPLRRKVLRIFIALKNPSTSARFEPPNI